MKARERVEENGAGEQEFENSSVFSVTVEADELARQRKVLDVLSVWSNMEGKVAEDVLKKELSAVEVEYLEAEGAKLLGVEAQPRDPRRKR
ncbi:hypothetical protein TrST_g7296 [Triparma strigata]|uniref:Uncharacterized protein n=1 Tax=Triparma strigata TaxID=1606541 RepID=A0A9W7BSZ7_9STRA|nr:hypothetical protein TrST_g7296 [Triparma strigata]